MWLNGSVSTRTLSFFLSSIHTLSWEFIASTSYYAYVSFVVNDPNLLYSCQLWLGLEEEALRKVQRLHSENVNVAQVLVRRGNISELMPSQTRGWTSGHPSQSYNRHIRATISRSSFIIVTSMSLGVYNKTTVAAVVCTGLF